MAQRRADGVHIGRPRVMADSVRERIGELREEGLSMAKVAARLNEESIPTAHGGKRWYASTVKRVLDTTEH